MTIFWVIVWLVALADYHHGNQSALTALVAIPLADLGVWFVIGIWYFEGKRL